jgi:hypothetical protein
MKFIENKKLGEAQVHRKYTADTLKEEEKKKGKQKLSKIQAVQKC